MTIKNDHIVGVEPDLFVAYESVEMDPYVEHALSILLKD